MIEAIFILVLLLALSNYLSRQNGNIEQPEVRVVFPPHQHDCVHCSLQFKCNEENCYGVRLRLCPKCGF